MITKGEWSTEKLKRKDNVKPAMPIIKSSETCLQMVTEQTTSELKHGHYIIQPNTIYETSQGPIQHSCMLIKVVFLSKNKNKKATVYHSGPKSLKHCTSFKK